jgi:hypothetical protein
MMDGPQRQRQGILLASWKQVHHATATPWHAMGHIKGPTTELDLLGMGRQGDPHWSGHVGDHHRPEEVGQNKLIVERIASELLSTPNGKSWLCRCGRVSSRQFCLLFFGWIELIRL